MTAAQDRAITLIEQQQKSAGKFTTPWMVGEQLKDMIIHEPDKAEIIAQDLGVAEMSLVHAEKQIKKWADKQKHVGNSVGVPPNVAEDILRKFYGLGEAGERVVSANTTVKLDIAEFL